MDPVGEILGGWDQEIKSQKSGVPEILEPLKK